MVFNVVVRDDDLIVLQEGGGLKKETMESRDRDWKRFDEYFKKQEPNLSVSDLLNDVEGKTKLEKIIGNFFFTVRVMAADDKTVKYPKKNTAEKMRSNLKCHFKEKFRIDITDLAEFPNANQYWKSFIDELAKSNRAETNHRKEVNPSSIKAIMDLLTDVKDALMSRGTPEYQEKLTKIPVEWQSKLNYLLMWGSIFIVMLFEVRRGREGIAELMLSDFDIINDNVYSFKYIRKTRSEVTKNHREGSNSSNHGVIPFLSMDGSFNPGEIFSYYIEQARSTDPNVKVLFRKPRDVSAKFNPHDPSLPMYENKKIGKNTVSSMLKNLCQVVGKPEADNHALRTTAIIYMRRSGLSWQDISKITGMIGSIHNFICNLLIFPLGHKRIETLIKNYDTAMEAPGLHQVANAIGHGHEIALGKEPVIGDLITRETEAAVEEVVKEVVENVNLELFFSQDPFKTAKKEDPLTAEEDPLTAEKEDPLTDVNIDVFFSQDPFKQDKDDESPTKKVKLSGLTTPAPSFPQSSVPVNSDVLAAEAAGRFVGAVGKSLMEGVLPLFDAFLARR